MNDTIKTSFWKQYGAAIDMFENAVAKCPPEIWDDERKFWYIAYHTLFFLDYYLDKDPDNFTTPQPFNMNEMEIDEVMPKHPFTKKELLGYVEHCRKKAHGLISGFNDAGASSRWKNQYREYSMFEMQLYNMRHVQEHAAELSMLIVQNGGSTSGWIRQVK